MDSCKVSRAGSRGRGPYTSFHTKYTPLSVRTAICFAKMCESERHRASRARLRGAQGCCNRRAQHQQAAGTHRP